MNDLETINGIGEARGNHPIKGQPCIFHPPLVGSTTPKFGIGRKSSEILLLKDFVKFYFTHYKEMFDSKVSKRHIY